MRIPILLLAAHVTFPNFLLNFLAVWPCCLHNHLTLFPFPSTQVSRKEKYSPKPSRENFYEPNQIFSCSLYKVLKPTIQLPLNGKQKQKTFVSAKRRRLNRLKFFYSLTSSLYHHLLISAFQIFTELLIISFRFFSSKGRSSIQFNSINLAFGSF